MSRPQSKLHYFGASEEEYFHKVADRRTRLVRPVAMFLVRRNVRADVLTMASFLLLPLFFFPFFGLRWYGLAWTALIASIVLDGLDGPVARLGRYASDKGALSDIVNDITAMVFVAITAMVFGFAQPVLCLLYVVTYLYMIVFIIARNVMEQPFTFAFKSKYYLFLFLLIDVHTGWHTLNPFLGILSAYQAAVCCVGFFHLRRHLPGVLGAGTRGAWPGTDKVSRRAGRQARRLQQREKILARLERWRGRR